MMRKQKGWVILAVALAILTAAPATGQEEDVTICDVQEYDEMGLSPLEGETVEVRGVVTVEAGVFQSDYTSFFIEWGDCGINVYRFESGIVTATVGDTIDVTGVVTEFQSSGTGAGSTTEIKMSSTSSWSMVGEGDGEFEPTYLNLQGLGVEENEGRLCRTIGVVREKNLPDDIYIHQPWSGADILVLARFNPAIDLSVYDVGDTIDVTGNMTQYDRTPPFFDGYQLSPRYQSDMKIAVPPPPPPPEFWSNSALRIPSLVFRPDGNEVIPIAYLAPEMSNITAEIFDLQGRLIRTLTEEDYTGYSSMPEFYKEDFFVDGIRGWDGRDDLRRLVPAGAYVCRLEVEDVDGRVSVSTAPIVVGLELTD